MKKLHKIKINNKLKAEKVLEEKGFRAKWDSHNLIVAEANYDRITDILSDNNIEYGE